MRRAPLLLGFVGLCGLVGLGACGDEDPAPARSAGLWDVDRNPRDDDCGLQVRKTVQWTITDGKKLVLDIGREALEGEEDGDQAVFRFTNEGESGGCSYTGELTVSLTLSEDDQRFTGDLVGYLRYSSGSRCGIVALNGPIRCDMDVGVAGRRIVEPR